MQAVPDIPGSGISPYNRIFYKLKINTISMAGYFITNYTHAVAFPAMNAIAALLLFFTIRCKYIIFYCAVCSILAVDTKKCIIKDIVLYNYILQS